MNKAIISILLVVTIAIPLWFDGHLYSVFDLSKITVLYILIFLLVALWAVRGGFRWAQNALTFPILAILASTIISTVFAVNPYLSFAGTYKRYGGLLSTMVYMVLFFAVVEFVNRDRIKTFMNVVVLTACVASVYGILQCFGLDPYNWTTNFGFGRRAVATFGHPSFFGAYLIMALPLVIYGILRGNKWMYPVAGLLMYALFLSKTRSAFVGMVAALIYFFVLYRHKVSYKVIGLVLAVIIGLSFVMPNSPMKRFVSDFKNGKPSGTIAERIKIGMVCLDIIRDNPVFGVGLDCLGTRYATYYETRYEEIGRGDNNRAHNAVLSILVEQGIVGLLAWLWFVVVYFRKVLANRDDLVVVALSSGVVAYMVQNLFAFGSPGITPLFWMLAGMTVVAVKYENKSYLERMFSGSGYSPWDVYNPSLHG